LAAGRRGRGEEGKRGGGGDARWWWGCAFVSRKKGESGRCKISRPGVLLQHPIFLQTPKLYNIRENR